MRKRLWWALFVADKWSAYQFVAMSTEALKSGMPVYMDDHQICRQPHTPSAIRS